MGFNTGWRKRDVFKKKRDMFKVKSRKQSPRKTEPRALILLIARAWILLIGFVVGVFVQDPRVSLVVAFVVTAVTIYQLVPRG